MKHQLVIYNSLSRKKELFKPLNDNNVGMYVCGPTVYGDAHLGHARPAITFDILFRYLKHLGYKVRYVRNITDVGHLENDADSGEDKIAKKARLEQLEPMEVVHQFTERYHDNMKQLNVETPSIEPRASGHIIEQIEIVKTILDNGFAYEVNGSVYFDVEKYNNSNKYGILSGRVLDDLQANTRDLDGQGDKKNPFDFALWKKADSQHIMRWPSEWSDGFPGWHLECTAMGSKYLGETFDIHGGGLDLLFPHHECEIAQGVAAFEKQPVKYWVHNNMITINGKKMGKSLNNFIKLDEFFDGSHELLEKPYSAMTIRFFILQAHYRSTVDFSNQALQAAEKGLEKLHKSCDTLESLTPSKESTIDISKLEEKCITALNDDLNTPILIAHLFDGIKQINSVNSGKEKLSANDIDKLKSLYNKYVFDILGLVKEDSASNDDGKLDNIMELIIDLRQQARTNKDWTTADKIRDKLSEIKISIKDTPDGATWNSED